MSKASNIFYDDTNTSFGDNTNNIQIAIEKLKKEIDNKIPTGNSNLASNILYDNSKTNLVYETEEYDFPKFKYIIPETINLLLSNSINDYPASIIKQEDGSYILNCDIDSSSESNISLIIKSIDGDNNIYKNYSILSQFFNFNELYNLEENEININNNTKIKFIFNNSDTPFISLEIINKPLESNIFLRLKNRELRNQDRYLFGLSEAFMDSQTLIDNYILEFVQDGNSVKLSGSYTLKEGAGSQIIFYNPIVENYFNIKTEFSDTTGIISSNGKKIKYTIAKASKNDIDVYLLFLQYEDDSLINAGDIITFNLIPDKNFILDKILKPVENIQELGESLALRYMISPYYIQYPDDEGNFNNKEEPSVWFKKMYGVATTWQIIFNDKSTFFRTEGIKSNVSRINGLQPYGMPNLSGHFKGGDTTIGLFTESSGVFKSWNNISSTYKNYMGSFRSDKVYPFPYTNVDISTNRQIKEYTNDLVVNNYQIRIYKLLTINGKKVSDIIGA